MKALVYQGPGKKAPEDRAKPDLRAPGDAIVRVTKTTICGTDLILSSRGPHSSKQITAAPAGRWPLQEPDATDG